MEQQANELAPQQVVTTGNQINVVILTHGANVKDISNLINHVSQGYPDTVFTLVGETNTGETDQHKAQTTFAPDIEKAIAQCTSRWIIFCDRETRLAAD